MNPRTNHRASSGLTRRLSSNRRVSGPARSVKPGQEMVDRLAREELPRLLALARRYSLCGDDANDACQRAMVILMRRAESLDPAVAHLWLGTVVKHEAMAVRAERLKSLSGGDDQFAHLAAPGDIAESADSNDRLGVASEAMRALKPHEAEALLLRAEGLSYKEIAARRGWTYTKVNRLVTEGRRAFRERVLAIETGAECGRVLAAVAETGAEGLDISARIHLARCIACRSEAREIHPHTMCLSG